MSLVTLYDFGLSVYWKKKKKKKRLKGSFKLIFVSIQGGFRGFEGKIKIAPPPVVEILRMPHLLPAMKTYLTQVLSSINLMPSAMTALSSAVKAALMM